VDKKIDLLPYRLFKKLKTTHTVKTVVLTDADMSVQGLHLAFRNHREYIEHKFKQLGVEVYRHVHDYNSLETSHPKLGLVYMVNDSVIAPGLEVHALMDHNARYINGDI
jgi:hypothetical protein